MLRTNEHPLSLTEKKEGVFYVKMQVSKKAISLLR